MLSNTRPFTLLLPRRMQPNESETELPSCIMMPTRPGTPSTYGRLLRNFADIERAILYEPNGIAGKFLRSNDGSSELQNHSPSTYTSPMMYDGLLNLRMSLIIILDDWFKMKAQDSSYQYKNLGNENEDAAVYYSLRWQHEGSCAQHNSPCH